ncbi:MAG: hypothetical protein HZA66_11950 [Rhodopseudomonas palustris]|uniref:Uncharacterized protein n=1 Tax=Rhodopseudomonas palustris TaxID=1076 RepID=A0A933W158_RHOPL|nr:hypothetical protein [Rhodopseudomonas palustris]
MAIRSGRMELAGTALAGSDAIPAAPQATLALETLALGGLLLLICP